MYVNNSNNALNEHVNNFMDQTEYNDAKSNIRGTVLSKIVDLQKVFKYNNNAEKAHVNSVLAGNLKELCFVQKNAYYSVQKALKLDSYVNGLNLTFQCENDTNTELLNVVCKKEQQGHLNQNPLCTTFDIKLPQQAQVRFGGHLKSTRQSIHNPGTIRDVILTEISQLDGFELPSNHVATFSSVVVPVPIEGKAGKFKFTLNLPNQNDNQNDSWVIGVYDTSGMNVKIKTYPNLKEVTIQSGLDGKQKNWACTDKDFKSQEELSKNLPGFKDYLLKTDGIVVFGVPFKVAGSQGQALSYKSYFRPVTVTHSGKSDPQHYEKTTSNSKMKVKDAGSFVTFIKPHPVNVNFDKLNTGDKEVIGNFIEFAEKNLTASMEDALGFLKIQQPKKPQKQQEQVLFSESALVQLRPSLPPFIFFAPPMR